MLPALCLQFELVVVGGDHLQLKTIGIGSDHFQSLRQLGEQHVRAGGGVLQLLPGRGEAVLVAGEQRGGAEQKDLYYFTGLNLTFRLGGGYGSTFASKNGRSVIKQSDR